MRTAAIVDLPTAPRTGSNSSSKAKQVLRSLLPQAVQNWREARYFARYGEIEMHLVEFLCRKEQDAIDVGANYGGYVHFMRRFAKRVIAFEPIPEFVRLLRRKFPNDVTIASTALSDRIGQTLLYTPVIDGVTVGGCSTLSADASSAYPAHDVIEVSMDRLDNVYGGTAGLIKIDVEGHEQAVLDGAVETIARCRPRILVEIEEHRSPGGLARAKAFFAERGYHGYYVRAGRLEAIERFSLAEMQSLAARPQLTATPREQPRSESEGFINNFIFLPPGEPSTTLDRMGERLGRL